MADRAEPTGLGLVAWRGRDTNGLVGCTPGDATIVGRAAWSGGDLTVSSGSSRLGAEGVPDTEITITDERVCGSVVVQEGVFGDTRTGSLVTPGDQVIPAPRRSLEAPCADFFEVEGGPHQVRAVLRPGRIARSTRADARPGRCRLV